MELSACDCVCVGGESAFRWGAMCRSRPRRELGVEGLSRQLLRPALFPRAAFSSKDQETI